MGTCARPGALVLGERHAGVEDGGEADGRQLERPVAQQEVEQPPHSARPACRGTAGAATSARAGGGGRTAGASAAGAVGGRACAAGTGRGARADAADRLPRTNGAPRAEMPGRARARRRRTGRSSATQRSSAAAPRPGRAATRPRSTRLIGPVSSLTTMASASVCSVMPRAARWRVP